MHTVAIDSTANFGNCNCFSSRRSILIIPVECHVIAAITATSSRAVCYIVEFFLAVKIWYLLLALSGIVRCESKSEAVLPVGQDKTIRIVPLLKVVVIEASCPVTPLHDLMLK